MPSDASTEKRDRRVPRARNLRRQSTDAEKKLWWHLRHLPIERSHFRRQATIGPYYADFACHRSRIVIEIDGGQHADDRQAARDAKRTAHLNSRGYRVLRFWNNEVLTNVEGVMAVILATIDVTAQSPHPLPLPAAARGEGRRTRRNFKPVEAMLHDSAVGQLVTDAERASLPPRSGGEGRIAPAIRGGGRSAEGEEADA